MSGRHYFAAPGELNKRQRILLAVVAGRASLDSISQAAEIPVPTVHEHVRMMDQLGWVDLTKAGDGTTVVVEPTDEGERVASDLQQRKLEAATKADVRG
jgi:predicted transcriptional regulator